MNEPNAGTGFRGSALGADPSGQAGLHQLAAEQSALRRVATLVAGGTAPDQVFLAVIEEVGRLLPVDVVSMSHYQTSGTLTFVARWGKLADRVPVGSRRPLGGRNVGTIVFETGRPARVDGYGGNSAGSIGVASREGGILSSVGSPIIVDGRLWGMIAAGSTLASLPPDTEVRLASFTELVGTAIANAESRAALARLAEEQAALRRVATLVARGTAPDQVFAAVIEEVGRLLPVDVVSLGHYQTSGSLTFVARWGKAAESFPAGSQILLGGRNVGTLVFETGLPARADDYRDSSSGPIGAASHEMGIRSSVGSPIIVDGRLWGVIAAGSTLASLPPDTEERLASFTELVATAIANADGRAELLASRARIVAAADEARRRIERDLHDGTQQQLVSLLLDLRVAQAAVPPELGQLEAGLVRMQQRITGVFDQVREISRGIHPAILSERGLQPALKMLARRSTVAVELDLHIGRRLPQPVEVAAYYAVSEALANAAKHAHASAVRVELDAPDGAVRLVISDDGVGGADPAKGSGLTGLRDRIEAVGGTLDVTSPASGGTALVIHIPMHARLSEHR